MAVRGVYTKAEKKMLEVTNKDAFMQVGWAKSPTKMVASEESIKNMGAALDYWNPLWRDDNYAMNTRWGGIIAPPMYQERFGYGYFVPAVTPEVGFPDMIYMGEDWEFFKPVRVNDSFKVWRNPPILEDITTLDGKGPRLFKFLPHDIRHINQKDELVSTFKLLVQFIIHPELPKKVATMAESSYRYTKEELAFIDRIADEEEVRGANIRYWEDVNVDDVTKPVVMGPTTVWDMASFNAGLGTTFHPIREMRKNMPWTIKTDPVTGVSYSDVEWHFSNRAAQMRGRPQAFHFGAFARQLMARLVTNWVGDDGFLRRFNWRHLTQTPIGDTVIGQGKVVNKRVQDGEHLVDLSVRLENIRGNITEAAVATVSLVSKEAPYIWK